MKMTKQEQELLELTTEFETKSKEMNKIIEKIAIKEKNIEAAKLDILELNTNLDTLQSDLIGILKKRQRISKKLFGVKNA